MAHNYIDTPGTERGDITNFSPAKNALDMSFHQPFQSPSKNPGQDLRTAMRGLRGAMPAATRTPRARTALVDRRNPAAKQEFTPLLKSARRTQLMHQSFLEEKENTESDSMAALKTPAGLRMSYGRRATPGLPVNSSMLEPDHTGSSADAAMTPLGPAAVSSSMLDSTPMPQLPDRSKGGLLEQGNVLSLRDQEAKLDQIQKDNFGLKLKIHFLEEALRKTGNEYHQLTLKENVELKTNRAELEVDLKRQRKRLQEAEYQLEEYRTHLKEYQEKVKKRHTNERDQEEFTRLQKLADDSQKVADMRERELDELREKLEQAERLQEDNDEVQRLKDDILDLEADMRDRERQLEEKDDQLESLQEKLKAAQESHDADDHDRSDEELAQLKDDMKQLQADLRDRQEKFEQEEKKVKKLQEQLDTAGNTTDAVEKLKEEVEDLQAELRDRERKLEGYEEKVEDVQDQLRVAKVDLDNLDQMQQDIEDLEAELKEKDDVVKAKDLQIADLQTHVNKSQDRDQSARKLRGDVLQLESRIRERDLALDESRKQMLAFEKQLQVATDTHLLELRQRGDELRMAQRELADKDGEIEALQDRLKTARGSWDAEAQQTDARLNEKDLIIREKESQLRENARTIEQRDDELSDLEKRLRAAEKARDDTTYDQTQRTRDLERQLRDMEEKLRTQSASSQAKLAEKDNLILSRETELQALQSRVMTLSSSENAQLRTKDELILVLQTEVKSRDREAKDQSQQIISLKSRLGAMETPSKKDSLLKQQAEQIRALQSQFTKLEQEKEGELDELDAQMQVVEKENADLRQRVDSLNKRSLKADRDQSLLGHQDEELQTRQQQMTNLETEIEHLQRTLRQTVEQRQRDVQILEKEVNIARASGSGQADEVRRQLSSLRSSLEAEHASARQALEDELLVLETSLEDLQVENATLKTKAQFLEVDLQNARQAAKDTNTGTPARERVDLRAKLRIAETECNGLRAQIGTLEANIAQATTRPETSPAGRERTTLQRKLLDAENKIISLEAKVTALQTALDDVQQERTLAIERADLHDLLKQARIEAETLQIELDRRDRVAAKAGASGDKAPFENAHALALAQADVEDLQTHVADLTSRLEASQARERSQRAQLKEFQTTQSRLADFEAQLGDHAESAAEHARRESELRKELRTAQAECDDLRDQLTSQEQRVIEAAESEARLRERLRRAQKTGGNEEDTLRLASRDLRAQLDDAELELSALQDRLHERDNRLETSQAREMELRTKIKALRKERDSAVGQSRSRTNNDGLRVALSEQHQEKIQTLEKRHDAELKGLVRQIQYLRARCTREEGFRADLGFIKKWFTLQVEMYSACNQADLRLLSDIGIPLPPAQAALKQNGGNAGVSIKQRNRPTLKAVGLTVVACLRVRRWQLAWAGQQKLQESLIRKLEGMRRKGAPEKDRIRSL